MRSPALAAGWAVIAMCRTQVTHDAQNVHQGCESSALPATGRQVLYHLPFSIPSAFATSLRRTPLCFAAGTPSLG